MAKSKKQTESLYSPSVKFLLLISFIEGAAVMGVELIGTKLIGPYYGTSLYVWSSVLAVTLGGLAGGYYLGGYLSEKFKDINVLTYTLALAALFTLIMPGWANIIMKVLLDLDVRTASLMSSVLFLMPPLLCFGVVSPVVIHIINKEKEHAGKSAGTIYAISTLGGIIMTLLTGFYLIPSLGLRMSAIMMGLIISIPALILLVKRKKGPVAVAITAILMFNGTQAAQTVGHENVVKTYDIPGQQGKVMLHHLSDGLNGQLGVIEWMIPNKNQHVRALMVNNAVQTKMHMGEGKHSMWPYVHRIQVYSSFKPAGSNVLICGLGGGNLVNEYNQLGFNVDVVEIDPRMEELAREYFFMNGPVKVYEDDARHYLNTTQVKYDIIVLDLSAGEVIPSNVYTVEGFEQIKSCLKEDGVIFLHYLNTLQGEEALAAKSIGKSMEKAGFDVNIFNTNAQGKYQEIMYFGATNDLDLTKQDFSRRNPFANGFNFPLDESMFIDFSFADGLLLTDDKPILEKLHLNTLEITRGEDLRISLRNYWSAGIEFI